MRKSISDRLKELRISAVPTLSIRRMAEELGMGHSSYVYFEDAKRYKKAALPIDLTRRIADVLQRYGVDPAEVMKLAGLSDAEAKPDVEIIEASRPPVKFFSFPIAMPSEAALTDMFESLLVLAPPDATRHEVAKILAQRLPSGFAAIGSFAIDQPLFHVSEASSNHQSPVTGLDAPEQESRTE